MKSRNPPTLAAAHCLAVLAALIVSALAVGAQGSSAGQELIVCGWDEVFILDMGQEPPRKVWSWKAADRPDLPAAMKPKFRTTDECKPVAGGEQILITSSSDGIALVERASGKVLFYGSAGGAHSAEMLPGGRIAVAASTSKNPLADSLVVFDIAKSDQPLFVSELVSGHGVVWDEVRKVLWTLSGQVLRTYKLVDWSSAKPRLEKVSEYPIPGKGGHDLQAVPRTKYLSVTAMDHAWYFDRDKKTFEDHPHVADQVHVKSITVNPLTSQVVWTRADEGFWWTDTLRFLNPPRQHRIEGERLYKARWAVTEDQKLRRK